MTSYSQRIPAFCDMTIKAGVFLIVLLVPLFYTSVTSDKFTIPKEALFLFLLLLCSAAWCIKTTEAKEFSPPKLPVSLPLLAFWFISFISILKADFNYLARRDLVALSSYLLFFFLLIGSLKTKKQANWIIFALIAAGIIAAGYGISQFYGYSLTFQLPPTERLRLYSTFGHPNRLSHYLAAILPISFSLFLFRRDKLSKVLLFLGITISYVFLLLGGTRAAILGAFFAAGSWLFLFFIGRFKGKSIFKRNWIWLAALTLTIILATITYSTDNPLNRPGGARGAWTAERSTEFLVEGTKESSARSRLWLWRGVLTMVKEHPLLGVGLGNFKRLSAEYLGRYIKNHPGRPSYPDNYKEAHNDYVQIWAETGIFGILIFLWFLFTLCIVGLKAVRKSAPIKSESKATDNLAGGLLLVGLLSGIVAYSVELSLEFPLHVIQNAILFATMAAILLAIPQLYEIDEPWQHVRYRLWSALLPKRTVIKRIVQVGIAILFVGLSFFIVQCFRADMHLQKGRVFATNNDPKAAYIECRKAASLWPYDWKIYYKLGLVYIAVGMYDEAITTFSTAERYVLRSDIAYYKGEAYRKQGKLEKAEEEYKRAIFYMPNFEQAYTGLGLLYLDKD